MKWKSRVRSAASNHEIATVEVTYGMHMISDGPLDRGLSHCNDVHVPAVQVVPFWDVNEEGVVLGIPVNHLDFFEADEFLVSRSCRDAGVHHEFYQFLALQRQLP